MLKHIQKRAKCGFTVPLALFAADLDGSLLDLVGAMVAILCLVTNKLTFFSLSFSSSIFITSVSHCSATKPSLFL